VPGESIDGMGKGVRWTSRRYALGLWGWLQQWGYLLCQTATACALVWWIPYKHLPWTGVCVAIIALLAAAMSVHPNIRPHHKLIYFSLMAFLLINEFRAMRKDRDEAQQTQNEFESKENTRLALLLNAERENTKNLLDQENKNLNGFLKQDQLEFEKTIRTLVSSHKQDQEDFLRVVNKEQGIVQSQQEMSEQFAGRLVPGEGPTPTNACSRFSAGENDVTVIWEDNAAVVNHFPATILEIGDTPVISVDRVPGSQQELALSADFRTKNNEIAIQVNKNGVVNRTQKLILMRPNKSTFLIEDSFGKEFFRAVYVNAKTFQVSGPSTAVSASLLRCL
jgi:membrane protein implicated in regulation of membrane protease activity